MVVMPVADAPADKGNAIQIQHRMQRQRQLALERQKAAAARQRLGVGVVASNPLPPQVGSRMSPWQVLDPQNTEFSSETFLARQSSGKTSSMARDDSGSGAPAGRHGTRTSSRTDSPGIVGDGSAGRSESHTLSRLGEAGSNQPPSAAREPTSVTSPSAMFLDDGLDVEELVDSLIGPPQGVEQALQKPVEVGGSRAGFEVQTAAPSNGVWGVDEKLKVQGPPPAVVSVAGFDNVPVPDQRIRDRARKQDEVDAPARRQLFDGDFSTGGKEEEAQPVRSKKWWKPWGGGGEASSKPEVCTDEVTQIGAFDDD